MTSPASCVEEFTVCQEFLTKLSAGEAGWYSGGEILMMTSSVQQVEDGFGADRLALPSNKQIPPCPGSRLAGTFKLLEYAGCLKCRGLNGVAYYCVPGFKLFWHNKLCKCVLCKNPVASMPLILATFQPIFVSGRGRTW